MPRSKGVKWCWSIGFSEHIPRTTVNSCSHILLRTKCNIRRNTSLSLSFIIPCFFPNIHYHVDYGHCENWKKWWNFDLMVRLEVKWFGCSVWEIWCIQQFMNSFFSSDIHWLTHWCSHEAVKISALQLNTHATEKYSLDKAPGTSSLSTKAEVQLHHNENVFFFPRRKQTNSSWNRHEAVEELSRHQRGKAKQHKVLTLLQIKPWSAFDTLA